MDGYSGAAEPANAANHRYAKDKTTYVGGSARGGTFRVDVRVDVQIWIRA